MALTRKSIIVTTDYEKVAKELLNSFPSARKNTKYAVKDYVELWNINTDSKKEKLDYDKTFQAVMDNLEGKVKEQKKVIQKENAIPTFKTMSKLRSDLVAAGYSLSSYSEDGFVIKGHEGYILIDNFSNAEKNKWVVVSNRIEIFSCEASTSDEAREQAVAWLINKGVR